MRSKKLFEFSRKYIMNISIIEVGKVNNGFTKECDTTVEKVKKILE
ncbi:MAG: hypothetical protein ACRC28_00310 [Clostridium sp.]